MDAIIFPFRMVHLLSENHMKVYDIYTDTFTEIDISRVWLGEMLQISAISLDRFKLDGEQSVTDPPPADMSA